MTLEQIFPSGLRLVFNQMKNTRSVSVGVFIKVGSEYESSDNNGIAHFMFKGTSKRNAFQIADDMEKIGARMNAYTSKNHTAYYSVSLDEHFENCMEMISDLIYFSKYDEIEMEKEKTVVIEEIQMSEDDPEDLCMDKLFYAWYGNEGPGRRILGTKDNINSFTQKNLFDFRDAEYDPGNMVISIAGNVDFEKAKDLVNKYFEANSRLSSLVPILRKKVIPAKESVLTIKPLEQANIAFAYRGIDYIDDRTLAINMMSSLFGGGMSSRLFQSIRETLGLAYNVYSSAYNFSDSGVFTIYLGTSPEKAHKAISEVKKQIQMLLEKGFSPEEFSKSKEQIKTALVLSLESSSSLMRMSGKRALLKNELFDYDLELDLLTKVTIEKLHEINEYVFIGDNKSISYVGKEPDFRIEEI
jgi:predicted Zn-dependent peptidase